MLLYFLPLFSVYAQLFYFSKALRTELDRRYLNIYYSILFCDVLIDKPLSLK